MKNPHYWQRYLRFIEACDGQTYSDLLYYERHHIVPRCCDGSDEPDNIIKLTVRQHYIAHILLAKATEYYGLYCAVYRMSTSRGEYLKSREIELAKLLAGLIPVPQSTRNKMAFKKIGVRTSHCEGRSGSEHHNYKSDLLHFYNESLNTSVFCTRLTAKNQASKLFGNISGVSAKRLYLGTSKSVKGWTCLTLNQDKGLKHSAEVRARTRTFDFVFINISNNSCQRFKSRSEAMKVIDAGHGIITSLINGNRRQWNDWILH